MQQELTRLAAMKDEDIRLDDPDVPPIENWDKAVRGKFYRPVKEPVTIRIDADVLAWFKARFGKYQTQMNQVLRAHMLHGHR
jgi:uncharacterized protein (DUF4415 family)